MSKGNVFASQLMNLIFKNITAANIGDGTGLVGSTGPGDLYVSLHTADPGEAGDATTNETAYVPYARIAVARGAGWTVEAADPDPASVSPAADIDFAECTSIPGGDLTHFAVSSGIDGVGSETILYSGTLTPDIVMAVGVIPRIKATSTITED
jgi:hypothetical protein